MNMSVVESAISDKYDWKSARQVQSRSHQKVLFHFFSLGPKLVLYEL